MPSAFARSTIRSAAATPSSTDARCVALVELLGGREGEVHLVEPALAQPVVASLVQREPGVDDALAPLDRRDDLLGPGHLRHVPSG